ncbi:hypothetical protein DNL40_02260 [Xylanimonas oleitrophica]|uniref:DUF2746 domain-containing protein n=1 Tax=Xylanimonas oleitrophica TaxID=2607479 RepID=A0A2W5WX34_9MICO|nr:DUF2746 domain-containing protein [Xylanimonas oleitrophica]PZR55213.1 hypothetical protein DNL40_02260 [Xylanimonas oleitrophica]
MTLEAAAGLVQDNSSLLAALGTVLGTAAMVALAYAGRWLKQRLDELAGQTRVVRDHVANTHSTNLRDDLDGVGAKVDAVLAGLDTVQRDIAGLRSADRQRGRELEGVREDIRRVQGTVEGARQQATAASSRVRGLEDTLEQHLVEARARDERITELTERFTGHDPTT